jgi:two-component system chemotaxis response regulator CheB
MPESIRVLLAEDSPTVRYHLARLINETPGLQVIGEARDGQEALDLAEKLKPDVISMDIRMPKIDGLEATRRIMAQYPTPIVVVSGLLDEDVDLSFNALQAGALAVVEKPPSRESPTFADKQRHLVSTLTAMAGVSVVRRWDRAPGRNGLKDDTVPSVAVSRSSVRPELLVIGASAGGPGALTVLLGRLPADLPIPVVIVQHMPDEFIPGLARALSGAANLPVHVAVDGQPFEPGVIYLSPGAVHLTIIRQAEALAARFIRENGARRYQPSVDVLMESAAAVCGAAGVGMILTGMGDDGAAGLLAMRQAGARTFAQDRVGCAVFGMPAAAIDRGAAEHVLPLERLSVALLRLL